MVDLDDYWITFEYKDRSAEKVNYSIVVYQRYTFVNFRRVHVADICLKDVSKRETK